MDKKIGPLKAWQWGMVAAAGGLLYWYMKRKGETSEQPASESFATGSQVGQGTEGTGGGVGGAGGGTPAPEAPAPAPAATQEPGTPAPGLGAGQLFAQELGEVEEGASALRASGLIPPSEGANPGTGAPAVKWSRNPAVRKLQQRALAKGENPNKVKLPKKPKRRPKPHAKQGAHHHQSGHKQPVHHKTPHPGAHHAARRHANPHPRHTQKPPAHHAASHHHRKKR